MPSPTRSRTRALAAAVPILALALAACGPNPQGTSATPAGTPDGSGAAACPAVAPPAGNPEGWAPPATAPKVVPVLISNLLDCGPNRVMFSVVNSAGTPIGAPDRSVSVAFFSLGRDPSTPIATADGTFIWAIEDVVGVYVASVSFPESGLYGVEFRTAVGSAAPEVVRLTFDVQPDTPVVEAGDPAPASKTPVLADVGGDVAMISTDTTPLPAFYETSIDQALAKDEPFVVIFATPAFCQTQQCGPTLDRIKPFVERYPTVTFINVEPYKLRFEGGSLQPELDAKGGLQPAGTTEAWRLINEPVVYVVGRDGIVRDRFELIFSDAELTAALDAVK